MEAVLGDDGGDLGSNAAGQLALVADHRAAGLGDRFEDGRLVERDERARVDHLG